MEKVLILTYYWPPAGGPGVQRWLKFAKYLPENGYEPVVLTVDPDKAEYPIRDESLMRDVSPHLQVFRTNCAGLYDYYKKFTKAKTAPYSGFANEGNPNLKQKIARFVRGNFFLPDARRGWNKYAYACACELVAKYDIKMVITTGPPMSTHLVGQRLKRHLGLYWLADFRDPWTDIFYYDKMYPVSLARRIDRNYERNVLLQADKVVTVSPYLRRQLMAKSPLIPESRIAVVTNGYDAEDFAEEVPKEKLFTITYTGTLTVDYTLDALIGALKALRQTCDFRLRFVGKVDPDVSRMLVVELGDRVEICPFVPHAEAIRHMKASSLLLLVIPNTPGNQGNLTGKLFEYVGSHTPVLCLGPTDGDAAAIIADAHAGRTFDYRDERGIAAYIEERMTLASLRDEHSSLIDKYSRRTLTRKLARLLSAEGMPHLHLPFQTQDVIRDRK